MDKTYNDGLIESLEEEKLAYAKELAAKREHRENSVKNLKIRKSAFRKRVGKFLFVGTVAAMAVGATYAYANDPERIVSNELLADAGLIDLGGKQADGEMTREELLQYIDNKDVAIDEVMKSVTEHLKKEDIDVTFGMDKVENANPDVFEEGKGMGR